MVSATMHPLTLRFSQPEQEAAARGTIFRSSYWILTAVFSLGVARHIFMAFVRPSLMALYMIYFPSNVVVLATRWYLHHHVPSDVRAHELNTRCWFCIILLCTIASRCLLYLDVFPLLDQATYIMYASSWGLTTIMMHAPARQTLSKARSSTSARR